MAVALFLMIVAVVVPCLLFAVWLVRYTGDAKSLRDAAVYLRAIPHPHLTVRLPARSRSPDDARQQ